MRPQSIIVVAACAAALLASVAPAAAQGKQDTEPRITGLVDYKGQRITEIYPGGQVFAQGVNLHECPPLPEDPGEKARALPCAHPGLSVAVDGEKAPLLSVNPGLIGFTMPHEIKPKKGRKVTIRIDGKGTADYKIDVVAHVDSSKDDQTETGSGPRGLDKIEQDVRDSFAISRFEMSSGAAGNAFVVEGRCSKLPDRLRVGLKLLYDNRTIELQMVPVEAGGFRCTFGPYPKKLLLGHYSVELRFDLQSQSRLALRSWYRKLPAEERDFYMEIVKLGMAEVGSGPGGKFLPEDREKQASAVQAHTLEVANETQRLMEELRSGFAVAARSFFKKPGQADYDRAAYQGYLEQLGVGTTPAEIEKFVKDNRFATASGHFKAPEFQEWIEKTFFKDLRAVSEKHVAFNGQFVCPPDERAELLGNYLTSVLVRLVQKWAGALYDKSQIQFPASMANPTGLSTTGVPQVSIKFFEAKRRELLRQVGLDSYVNAPGE